MTYPRPLTSIHQIEPTSHCQLRCRYCPSPKLEQFRGAPKEHMGLDTFSRALEWAVHYEAQGTQGELSLTGIGETLLHPEWRELVALAREALPNNPILFSTNGILLTRDTCAHLAEHRVGVFVSLHRPEKAGHAIQNAKDAGIYLGHNASAAIDSFDWAGQLKEIGVDWPVSAQNVDCEYLRTGWGVVYADGRIVTCCLDASGTSTVAHVNDEIGEAYVKPHGLCGDCHMRIVDPVDPTPYVPGTGGRG